MKLALPLTRLSAGHYQVKSYPNIYIDLLTPEWDGVEVAFWNIVIDGESYAGSETLWGARNIIVQQLNKSA